MFTRKVLSKKDIELQNKLDEMVGYQISENIYAEIHKSVNIQKIENKIWAMLGDKELPYSDSNFFDNKAEGLFSCNLIYMQAIAIVLNKPFPMSANEMML